MIHKICNSYYVSHFAAFFIDARTKRSVVESFEYLCICFYTLLTVSCNCIFVCVLRAALWAVASPKHQCTQKNVHTCLHCVYVVLCAEPPSQRAPGRAPTAAAQLSAGWHVRSPTVAPPSRLSTRPLIFSLMILPQVHLRKPCYDF